MKSNNEFHLSSKLADPAKRKGRSQDWSFLLDTVLPRLDWLSDGGKRRLVPGGDSSLGGASSSEEVSSAPFPPCRENCTMLAPSSF